MRSFLGGDDMEKREYIPWDTSKAGVSFSLEAGRIKSVSNDYGTTGKSCIMKSIACHWYGCFICAAQGNRRYHIEYRENTLRNRR